MYPTPIQNLITLFAKFPGVGPRQAARFVFYLLKETPDFRNGLAKDVAKLSELLLACARCGNIEAKKDADKNLCSICADEKRNQKNIAVVEDVMDLRALEQTRTYNGVYHVLSGPVVGRRGAVVDLAPVKKLINRVKQENPTEVIIATSPTYEGDATARYLARELLPLGTHVTHLARGLAKGVDLEYVDEETLKEALAGRH